MRSIDDNFIELVSAALILISIMAGLYISKSVDDNVQRQIEEAVQK